MQKKLSGLDRARIQVRAHLSEVTVRAVFAGGGSASSRERVIKACADLGLPQPVSEREERGE